ncbi:MAG TPA: proline racemase family protein [Acidimicrobiia bacterium]
MDGITAMDWQPPPDWRRITTIESHAGGEPFRVVVDGLPAVLGETMLERRRFAESELDWLRRALMWEPRGHADMYGGWLGPPVSADAELSVLFTHNDGFSTMCGHGIIALTTVLIETGMVSAPGPEHALAIDTPAGLISAVATVAGARVLSTRFRNVASFVTDIDAAVPVPGWGEVVYDLAFGGAFYALVDAATIGVTLDDSRGLIDAGRRIKEAISSSREVRHPEHPDLGFLYGVIFVGPPTTPGADSRNVCVFADGEIDRSPTGTGVSARLAALHARGEVGVDEEIRVESIVGSTFAGRIVGLASVASTPAVIPEVSGSAAITGRNEIWIDPEDRLGAGFLLR